MAILSDIGVALKSLFLKILNVFLRLKIPTRLDLKQTILFMDGHYLKLWKWQGMNDNRCNRQGYSPWYNLLKSD